MAEADGAGVKVLARETGQLTLRPIHTLDDDSCLAKVTGSHFDRHEGRDGITVWMIRHTLNDPSRVGHCEENVLLTKLFDEALHPATELLLPDPKGWEQEPVLDGRETHQEPRRATEPAPCRSGTPTGVLREVYPLALGHLVNLVADDRGRRDGERGPDRLAFSGCLRVQRHRMPECAGKSAGTHESWYRGLHWEMRRERIDPRRDRFDLRMIERKMSKWKENRPEHRRLPLSEKILPETGVMTQSMELGLG